MSFLARYWRVVAILLALGAVLIAIQRCTANAEHRGYQRARDDMSIEVNKANARTAALEQRQRAQSDAAAAAWEKQREDLQSRVDSLLTVTRPVVRLCREPRAAPVSQPASPAGSFDDPAGGRIDAVSLGPDIGGAAVLLAGECERYRAQLSALQAWIIETHAP